MEETPLQKQARLRREKRAKKILEGGSSRLDKITSLSGRPAPEPDTGAQEKVPQELPLSFTNAQAPVTSRHANAQPSTSTAEVEARAALRGFLQKGGNEAPAIPGESANALNGSDVPLSRTTAGNRQQSEMQDPIRQLLQQTMGMPLNSDSSPGEAPALEKLLYGTATPGQESSSTPQQKKRASVWKLLHPVLALTLGLYIHQACPFNGTSDQRIARQLEDNGRPNVFWLFATVELFLQSARYALERGQDQPGMLTTAAEILPEPWKRRAKLMARYNGIWTTLVSDALVVIWVLGAAVWWQGGAE